VAALERFYAGVLGLEVTRRVGDGAEARVWLDADDTIVMLEPRGPDEPEIPPGCLELVAFALAPRDYERLRARLEAAGVAVEARTPSTLYLRDPDGRRVGLSAYPDTLP